MHYLITSLSDDPRREYRSPQRMYRSPQRTPRYRSPTGSADSNQDEVVPPGVANSPTLVGPRRKLVCDDEPVHVLFSLKPYAPDTLCLSLCAERVQRRHFFLEPEDLRRSVTLAGACRHLRLASTRRRWKCTRNRCFFSHPTTST